MTPQNSSPYCAEYLDAMIQRHLQICSDAEATPTFPLASTAEHISHRYHPLIANSMQALRTFVPRSFSARFKNPCWYDHLVVPKTLYRKLTHYPGPLPHTEQYYNEQQVAKLVETVVGTRQNRSSQFFGMSVVGNTSSSIVSPDVSANGNLYCLPSILLAGFPKCATSTLHNMLLRHPMMVPTLRKEIQFWREFFHPGYLPHQQLKVLYYLYWMQRASKAIENHPNVFTLDASTTTVYAGMNLPIQRDSDMCIVPRVISEVIPDIKVVVLMRNPVDRLYSDFWYLCSKFSWQVKPATNFRRVKIPDQYLANGTKIFHEHSFEMVRQFRECLRNKSEFECARIAGMMSTYTCKHTHTPHTHTPHTHTHKPHSHPTHPHACMPTHGHTHTHGRAEKCFVLIFTFP